MRLCKSKQGYVMPENASSETPSYPFVYSAPTHLIPLPTDRQSSVDLRATYGSSLSVLGLGLSGNRDRVSEIPGIVTCLGLFVCPSAVGTQQPSGFFHDKASTKGYRCNNGLGMFYFILTSFD